MGGFVPGPTGLNPTASGSLPQPNPTGNTNTPPPTGYGGFSFAAGGALPGTNRTMTTPTIDPALTNQMLQFLGSNIGQGLPAFNQSINLPSGGSTAPGALSAPLNPVMQQLQDFMTGKSGPGSLPGVLPMWQSEMAAMQGPIEQNLGNLKEQFASRGALGSTELGSASMDYLSQTSADQMSLLTSATMASLPNMLQTGMGIQGIDQAAISNAYQQFMTDLPQNNPLLPAEMSMAQMHAGQTYSKQPSLLDSLGSSLMPGLAGNLGSAAGAAAASSNAPGWLSILLGA